MDLGDGILNRHGDVFLGNIRRGAGAAVAAVDMDDVRAGIVRTHGYHVHIVWAWKL